MRTAGRTANQAGAEVSAAVIVCTSSRERAQLVGDCVRSLLGGERPPDELLVVVDSNPPLARDLSASLPAQVRLLECRTQGLSAARNVGIAAAGSEVVAFIDDDAIADRKWLASLIEVFAAQPDVLGAGGPVLPRWAVERRWMPDELLWVVGCTYGGHRRDAGPIRNPIGCNMAFRRRELVALGSFEPSFGKRGKALATCDETELGLRVERVHGPGRIQFVPEAPVHHLVPATRISWRLVIRRSLSEGLAKARLRRLYRQPALGPERSYVRLLLSDSVPRLLRDGVRRRDPNAALAAAAIVASLTVTAAAFAAGTARWRGGRSQPTKFEDLSAGGAGAAG